MFVRFFLEGKPAFLLFEREVVGFDFRFRGLLSAKSNKKEKLTHMLPAWEQAEIKQTHSNETNDQMKSAPTKQDHDLYW